MWEDEVRTRYFGGDGKEERKKEKGVRKGQTVQKTKKTKSLQHRENG